jgi:hypothetical protein
VDAIILCKLSKDNRYRINKIFWRNDINACPTDERNGKQARIKKIQWWVHDDFITNIDKLYLEIDGLQRFNEVHPE